MAIKCTQRLSKIVFVGPVGIAPPGSDTEILDLFSTPMAQFGRAAFHDPSAAARAIRPFSEDDQMWVARAREATALLAWSPYMHNPKLLRRLGRISTPALCLWGDADGVVGRDYAQEFAAAMSDCAFKVVADVGHYPEVERPSDIAAQVAAFLRDSAVIREPAEAL
jgi:pimeloyl-ACP methyl ester carboxylesterase